MDEFTRNGIVLIGMVAVAGLALVRHGIVELKDRGRNRILNLERIAMNLSSAWGRSKTAKRNREIIEVAGAEALRGIER